MVGSNHSGSPPQTTCDCESLCDYWPNCWSGPFCDMGGGGIYIIVLGAWGTRALTLLSEPRLPTWNFEALTGDAYRCIRNESYLWCCISQMVARSSPGVGVRVRVVRSKGTEFCLQNRCKNFCWTSVNETLWVISDDDDHEYNWDNYTPVSTRISLCGLKNRIKKSTIFVMDVSTTFCSVGINWLQRKDQCSHQSCSVGTGIATYTLLRQQVYSPLHQVGILPSYRVYHHTCWLAFILHSSV